jgi:hypothetical protein
MTNEEILFLKVVFHWVLVAYACDSSYLGAEISRIEVKGQTRQIVCETLSPK